MFEASFEDIRDDFHVAMRVRTEAFPGSDAIVVDDTQGAKAQLGGVVVFGEGKREIGIQPAAVGMSPFFGFTDGDHVLSYRIYPVSTERPNRMASFAIRFSKVCP